MTHIRPGYDSRCCFCLFSRGHPARAIRENHKNPLARVWQPNHFFIKNAKGEQRFSCCRLIWSLSLYPLGMLGFLVDTVLKTILFIGNLIAATFALCSCHPGARTMRAVLLLDNLTSICICIIGILMPPLAYRLDRAAHRHFLTLL